MNDEWGVIAGFLDDVVDTRSFGLACTEFREIMLKVKPDYARECGTLEVMTRKFPDAPWDWDAVRRNEKRWRNKEVIIRPGINPHISACENLRKCNSNDLLYGFDIVSHPMMKDSAIAEFEVIARDWFRNRINAGLAISLNPALTWKDIAAHPEIPWHWQMMSNAYYI